MVSAEGQSLPFAFDDRVKSARSGASLCLEGHDSNVSLNIWTTQTDRFWVSMCWHATSYSGHLALTMSTQAPINVRQD